MVRSDVDFFALSLSGESQEVSLKLAAASEEIQKTKRLVREKDAAISALKEELTTASELEEQTVSELEEKLVQAGIEIEDAKDLVGKRDRVIAELKSELSILASKARKSESEVTEAKAKLAEEASTSAEESREKASRLEESDTEIRQLKEMVSAHHTESVEWCLVACLPFFFSLFVAMQFVFHA